MINLGNNLLKSSPINTNNSMLEFLYHQLAINDRKLQVLKIIIIQAVQELTYLVQNILNTCTVLVLLYCVVNEESI